MGSWSIVIPAQGISIHGDTKKITDFLNSEIAYYTRLGLNGANITFANQTYGSLQLTEPATRELSGIVADVQAEKTTLLEHCISDANNRQILVGSGPLGKKVEEIKKESQTAAVIFAAMYSPKWGQITQQLARDLIATFRSIALANPTSLALDDLLEASQAAAKAGQAQKESRESVARLDAFIDEKEKLISELENLYRRQLTIQEPAVSWQRIAAQKTNVWRFWLALFACMIAIPISVALLEWETVTTAVTKMTAASTSGFSISGLAIITVPALFYAWLLKNISRVFIQNLNLADDADHRRSLALTYMGLLQDEKRPTTDQDRAIVLNALFRPIPPHTGDEGPPSGLIELIKK
jgi:hypothetical protein